MGKCEIRLECLKLANRPDRDASAIVGRAKEFEDYVMGGEQPKPVDYFPEVQKVDNCSEPTDKPGKTSLSTQEEAKPAIVFPKGKHKR